MEKHNLLKAWTLALLTVVLVLGVVFFVSKSFADHEGKTFVPGKVVEIRALMCFEKDAAVVIAKLKNTAHPLVNQLATSGACVIIHGYGKYNTKVADEGEWTVWEVQFGNFKAYEATDWKPQELPSA